MQPLFQFRQEPFLFKQFGDDTVEDGLIVDQGGPAMVDLSGVEVPTLTDWGMILFLLLAGLASVVYLRRKSVRAKNSISLVTKRAGE